jgi:hypothetical protein
MSRRFVMLPIAALAAAALVAGSALSSTAAPQPQAPLPVVAGFPGSPSPAQAFDWRQRTLDYDEFVYDWSSPGAFDTIQVDATHYNMSTNTYKMPSYYGDPRLATDGFQEGLNQIASVVGASLVGVDKSNQDGFNYVDMLRTFYHPGLGVATNNPIDLDIDPGPAVVPGHSSSWWYTTTANVLYYMLGDLYPGATNMEAMLASIADKYYDAVVALGSGSADFGQQGFNFDTMQPYAGNRVEGGDGAAGTAAILLWAYAKFGDSRYLQGAKWAMDYLERSNGHLYYEILPNLGPYIAARLNAEFGTSYDVTRQFGDMLSGSTARPGWGTIEGSWNGYDVAGLQGSRTDDQGYAFAMNSFSTGLFVSTAKYDTRYADTVGRFMLNVNNAARYFYADQMPATNQAHGSTFLTDPAHVVPYEGLRHHEDNQSPRATGDPHKYWQGWGLPTQPTDLGLYGGSWVGFLGATLAPTNVANVLRVDLNALDFYGANTYPTYLYYNPTGSPANVQVTLPSTSSVYDAVSDTVLVGSASGSTTVMVPPGSSRVLVLAPANPTLTRSGGKTLIGGEVVGYRTGTPDLAYGRTATATSTVNGNVASHLTDGTAARRWESQSSDPQSVTVDLGAATIVNRVVLKWEAASAKSFQVQVSTDNANWSTVYSTTAGPGGVQTVTFSPVTARYVRILMTERNTQWAYSIYDLEVYRDDLAASRPVTVSSTDNGNLGGYLTDGTTATRWESQAVDPQGIQVDLGQTTAVGRVVLKWEAASAKNFEVWVSPDGTNWTTVYTTTNGPGGVQTIAFAPVNARYVFVYMTQRNTQWAYSMYDLEVYSQ